MHHFDLIKAILLFIGSMFICCGILYLFNLRERHRDYMNAKRIRESRNRCRNWS